MIGTLPMATTYVSEIEQIVQMIFSTMLSMEVQSIPSDPSDSHRFLGMIHVTGDNPVSLALSVSEELARAASANMLALAVDEVSEEDQQDVVAELTNMIGGNLKSLIPGVHYLSLPTVVEGRDLDLQIPGTTLTDDVLMQGASGTLRVRLFVK